MKTNRRKKNIYIEREKKKQKGREIGKRVGSGGAEIYYIAKHAKFCTTQFIEHAEHEKNSLAMP